MLVITREYVFWTASSRRYSTHLDHHRPSLGENSGNINIFQRWREETSNIWSKIPKKQINHGSLGTSWITIWPDVSYRRGTSSDWFPDWKRPRICKILGFAKVGKRRVPRISPSPARQAPGAGHSLHEKPGSSGEIMWYTYNYIVAGEASIFFKHHMWMIFPLGVSQAP